MKIKNQNNDSTVKETAYDWLEFHVTPEYQDWGAWGGGNPGGAKMTRAVTAESGKAVWKR